MLAALVGFGGSSAAAPPGGHEVWAIDQSDTTLDGGGTLYIYDGRRLSGRFRTGARPEVIDLGGAGRSSCLAQTGTAPRRPHMVLFNPAQSHAVVAFVATGHVLFMDSATRSPVSCIDVGVQAHAAYPTPDSRYVIVANQNGKLLQRIRTDYATNTFALEPAATLNLATCTTPSGAACESPSLRPDNAPICPVVDSTSRLSFVTLRGGGMFVVDHRATPMTILAEYDREAVHPNGCGGVEAAGKMYVNSGGGTPANPFEADLYAFPLGAFSTTPQPPNTPAPKLVFSHDDRGFVDSHGAALVRGRYLWVADRASNWIVVVDTTRDVVVSQVDLAGWVSGDPAPDLLGVSPNGNRVYLSLRGPNPLTANAPGANNAVGTTPGVGVMSARSGGRWGELRAVAPISRVVGGVEQADPHALAVRQT
jgi:DNA-binding beta-propeller fold protein YncE